MSHPALPARSGGAFLQGHIEPEKHLFYRYFIPPAKPIPEVTILTDKLNNMKKLLAILTIAFCCTLTTAMAQGGGQMDPAQMLEMMKQRVKPQLIEKTKLTDAQADKVLEVQLWSQLQMRGLRDLSEDDRAKKMKETNDEREKKLKAIPLTDDQIKAVNDFYEEQRKNRGAGRGGGK